MDLDKDILSCLLMSSFMHFEIWAFPRNHLNPSGGNSYYFVCGNSSQIHLLKVVLQFSIKLPKLFQGILFFILLDHFPFSFLISFFLVSYINECFSILSTVNFNDYNFQLLIFSFIYLLLHDLQRSSQVCIDLMWTLLT
jgi:hypothetical protein